MTKKQTTTGAKVTGHPLILLRNGNWAGEFRVILAQEQAHENDWCADLGLNGPTA